MIKVHIHLGFQAYQPDFVAINRHGYGDHRHISARLDGLKQPFHG